MRRVKWMSNVKWISASGAAMNTMSSFAGRLGRHIGGPGSARRRFGAREGKGERCGHPGLARRCRTEVAAHASLPPARSKFLKADAPDLPRSCNSYY